MRTTLILSTLTLGACGAADIRSVDMTATTVAGFTSTAHQRMLPEAASLSGSLVGYSVDAEDLPATVYGGDGYTQLVASANGDGAIMVILSGVGLDVSGLEAGDAIPVTDRATGYQNEGEIQIVGCAGETTYEWTMDDMMNGDVTIESIDEQTLELSFEARLRGDTVTGTFALDDYADWF